MKTLRFLSLVLFAALVLAVIVGCSPVQTAKFPEKPVTIIVHASAGGGSDIFARTLSAAFEKEKILSQPIAVENKPGGSGAVAFAYVAGKKGEPYYMLTAVASFLTTPLQGLSQVTYKDFTPICNLAFDEFVAFVRPESKFKTMKDIVDYAKANPKQLNVGGTQLGAADSIATYLIEKNTGAKFNYITFNSGGEVNAAVMGGHVEFAIGNPSEIMELQKGGKIRILGSLSEKRLGSLPDVPTMKEQGIDAIFQQNRGLVAPGGISDADRQVLEDAMLKYSNTDTFKAYVKDNSLTEAWMDGPTYGKWMESENSKYATLLQDMGVIKGSGASK
ncbi:MAG: tripartite tricarboxylate transporter substrate binding protein [Chloroflexi bacterium]|nr:tripartite tricarboxylate transporter substrate binding protein [Chloroflexota bacterium]